MYLPSKIGEQKPKLQAKNKSNDTIMTGWILKPEILQFARLLKVQI